MGLGHVTTAGERSGEEGQQADEHEASADFSPSPHGEVGDGVVVGLEHLGVVEDLVPERVEPVQRHSDVGGRHPVLRRHKGKAGRRMRCGFAMRRASSVGNAEEFSGARAAAAAGTPADYPTSPLAVGAHGKRTDSFVSYQHRVYQHTVTNR